MLGSRGKERERYYLFPGMGGRAARRKRRMMLLAGIAIGTIASAVLIGVFYLLNRH